METKDFNYRRAETSDAFELMNLYQRCCTTERPDDAVLLDYKELLKALVSEGEFWFLSELDGKILSFFSMMTDAENRLAKINRVVIDPEWKESSAILKGALPLLLERISDTVDLIYTTTRTLTLQQQELTLAMGFKVLGVFPNAIGADRSRVNGISAYYLNDVLKERQATFSLHPQVAPFFELVRKQTNLPALPKFESSYPTQRFHDLPELEIINAPGFVKHRFERLKERKSISVHFYPFQEPNVLITGPQQKIEIFVKYIPEMKFAAVIGERLDVAVDPTRLYDEISLLLREINVSYIETINDAGDVLGIDAIIRAGYLPSCYIPCFKKQGNQRRDYVVLSRSFERLFGAKHSVDSVNPLYLDFLAQYFYQEEETKLDNIGKD